MEFLKELAAISPLPNLKLNQPLIKRVTKGDIGIEVELEGELYSGDVLLKYKSERTGVNWITHRDDSLRNGVEYVLSSPCIESEVDPLVRYLYGTLREKKSRITLSNRTSTHVHINVQGLKPSELTSFVCLWGLFEQASVNYSGILRKCNQFCLTSKDTNGWLPTAWRDALESGNFRWDNGVKYSALNLAAFSNFGSFEFRTMEGCSQPERVISWARFLVRLRDTAVQYLPSEIGRGASEKTPTGFLREVCGDDLEEFAVSFQEATPAFDDVCMDSFRDYQELAFFVPWENLRDQINRREIRRPFEDSSPKIKIRRPPTRDEVRMAEPVAAPAFQMDWEAIPLRNQGIVQTAINRPQMTGQQVLTGEQLLEHARLMREAERRNQRPVHFDFTEGHPLRAAPQPEVPPARGFDDEF